MRKAIIPTAILCTAICIGLHSQTNKVEEPIITPEPPKIEVTVTPTPTPEEIEIADEIMRENGNKVGTIG